MPRFPKYGYAGNARQGILEVQRDAGSATTRISDLRERRSEQRRQLKNGKSASALTLFIYSTGWE